jgi:hypothetical protein
MDFSENAHTQCGRGLAREGGLSFNDDVDWNTAFASKPAAT